MTPIEGGCVTTLTSPSTRIFIRFTPLDGLPSPRLRSPIYCLATSLIYSAYVATETLDKIYYGSIKGRFKKRYDKHNYDFRHRAQRKATELSKLIWDQKDANIEYTIIWDIDTKAQPYVGGSKRCDLCLSEELAIAQSTHPGMISSCSEIVSKCRHMNNFLLKDI